MSQARIPSHAATALADPAFEPHANYLFEEEDGQEADRATCLRHASTHQTISLDPDCTEIARSDQTGLQPVSAIQRAGPISPLSPFWSYEQSSAYENVSSLDKLDLCNRLDGHGQITPPSDKDNAQPGVSVVPPRQPGTPSSSPPASSNEQASNPDSKIKRPHVSANWPSSIRKRAQSEDTTANEDPLEAGGDVAEHKRERYREKNRLAAAKCRAKKKQNSTSLEDSARDSERENTRLKLEERKLRDELTQLKEITLAHHPGHCSCNGIHQYNDGQALRTAQGAQSSILRPRQSSSSSLDCSSPLMSGINRQPARSYSFAAGYGPVASQSSFPQFPSRSLSAATPFTFSDKEYEQYAAAPEKQHEDFMMDDAVHSDAEHHLQSLDDDRAFQNFLESMDTKEFELD